MATRTIKRQWSKHSKTDAAVEPFEKALYEEFNKVQEVFNYKVENLAAGADITERGFFVAPAILDVQDSVKIIPEAASVGVDGANTLVVTLRNITQAVDIATVTRTTNLAANTPVALTLTAANADVASGDVLGLVVTQGATADANTFVLQFAYKLAGPLATIEA